MRTGRPREADNTSQASPCAVIFSRRAKEKQMSKTQGLLEEEKHALRILKEAVVALFCRMVQKGYRETPCCGPGKMMGAGLQGWQVTGGKVGESEIGRRQIQQELPRLDEELKCLACAEGQIGGTRDRGPWGFPGLFHLRTQRATGSEE